jgi:succinate-acetate transporter protein
VDTFVTTVVALARPRSQTPHKLIGHAVGVYLWAWAIFTAYMTVAALRVSGAVLLVFVPHYHVRPAGDRCGRPA